MRLKQLYESVDNIHIGQSYKGGIIGSIYTVNSKSYFLICKTINEKHENIDKIIKTSIDDGYNNTYKNRNIVLFNKIINTTYNGYNDWYIPSIEEILSLDINTHNDKIFLSSSKNGKKSYVANIKSPIKMLAEKGVKYDILIMRREETLYNPLQKIQRQATPVEL